jgi:TonB-linked SusC/RagA family outer membrane protein
MIKTITQNLFRPDKRSVKRLFKLVAIILMCTSKLYAQNGAIKIIGTVTDDHGETVIGATVKVKGSTNGTLSNINGNYTISIPNDKVTLVYSYIGLVSKEELVGTRKVINVVLNQNSTSLSEVVVVGYGQVNRKDLTGSVGSVNVAELGKAPVKSFDDALAGRVAGVQVTSPDGQPGAAPAIVIRGGNSVTQDNSPLYVIDGFPIENYNNNAINPADIESIDILKDASSTAIYGARGANGVIIITTKKGKTGAPVVTYDSYYGIQSNTNTVKVMDPYNYLKYTLEVDSVNAYNADYTLYNVYSPLYNPTGTLTVDAYANAPSIDWQSQIFRKSAMQSHNVSIRGGTKDTKYTVSGSFVNQDGTVIGSGFKRYQTRLILDQNLGDKLKVGINANYSYIIMGGDQVGGTFTTADPLLISTWRYRPMAAPGQDLNALLTGAQDPAVITATNYEWNPILTATQQINNKYNSLLTANAYIDYSILKDLRLKMSGGINVSNLETDRFNTSISRLGSPISTLGQGGPNGSVTNGQLINLVNENTLTYNKVFAKKHMLNILTGFSIGQNTTSSNSFGALKVPNESLGVNGLSQGTPSVITTYKSVNTLASFLGRVNYSYDSKYLATASFRADGSSKFLGGNVWGYFPSGSLAWHISQEDFLKNNKIVSDVKLRTSYGIIGNNRVNDEATYALLGTGASVGGLAGSYSANGVLINGTYPINLANPALKWESTIETDFGLDLGFLNQRITLTTDVYNKTTSNLLLNASLPGSSGYLSAFQNIGSVQNKGLEISLSTINITKKDFSWSSSFNISFNRNKVLSLTSGQQYLTTIVKWEAGNTIAASPGFIAQIGQPVGMFYGLTSNGVYQLSDFTQTSPGVYALNAGVPYYGTAGKTVKPGYWKYQDSYADGVIDVNDAGVIGNPNPKFIGGFTNNFTYKGFDLNVFFQFSYGNQIMNVNRILMEGGGGISNVQGANQFATYDDRWTPANPSNTYAVATAGGSQPAFYSSRDVEDGSFIRLKTVNLGYRFNTDLIKKAGMSSLRIYVSAQNLYTWTKYSGLDPEVNSFQSALTPGIDYSAYPRAKVITMGLDLSF